MRKLFFIVFSLAYCHFHCVKCGEEPDIYVQKRCHHFVEMSAKEKQKAINLCKAAAKQKTPDLILKKYEESAEKNYIPAMVKVNEAWLEGSGKYWDEEERELYNAYVASKENKKEDKLSKKSDAEIAYNSFYEGQPDFYYYQEIVEELKDLLKSGQKFYIKHCHYCAFNMDVVEDTNEIPTNNLIVQKQDKEEELEKEKLEKFINYCNKQTEDRLSIVVHNLSKIKDLKNKTKNDDIKAILSNFLNLKTKEVNDLEILKNDLIRRKLSKKSKHLVRRLSNQYDDLIDGDSFVQYDENLIEKIKNNEKFLDYILKEDKEFQNVLDLTLNIVATNNNRNYIVPDYESGVYFDMVKYLVDIHDNKLGKDLASKFFLLPEIEKYAIKSANLAKFDDIGISYIYANNAREVKKNYHLWLLNNSYNFYEQLFDNEFKRISDFLEFGNEKRVQLSQLTFKEIDNKLTSKEFFGPYTKEKQDIWVLKDNPYAIRVKKDKKLFTISLLKDHPYSSNGKLIKIKSSFNLICDPANELIKYRFNGFSNLIPGTRYEDNGSYKESDSRWYGYNKQLEDSAHFPYK